MLSVDDLPPPDQPQSQTAGSSVPLGVDDLPPPDGGDSTTRKAWNAFKDSVGGFGAAGAKALTLGYLDTPDMESSINNAPISAKIGRVAGSVVPGVLAGEGAGFVLGPIADASGLIPTAARIGANATGGAALGLAAKPEGSDTLSTRIDNAESGAAWGAGLATAAEAVSPAASWFKGVLDNYSADKSAKAIGLTKADYKKMGPDAARALGKYAMDNGLITLLATPSSIEAATDAGKEVAGEKIGQLIDSAQTQLDKMPPTGMMPAGAPIQATPIRPGQVLGKTENQTVVIQQPKTIDSALPPPFSPENPAGMNRGRQFQVKGDIGQSNLAAINGAGFDPYNPDLTVPVSPVTRTIEQAGPTEPILTPIKPRPAGSVDAPAIAQSLASNPALTRLSTVPGMEGVATRAQGYIDTLAKNPSDMNLRQTQELRQGVDAAINWTKGVPEMAAAQQHLVDIRNALSDAMANSVDQAASQHGGALGSLKQANSTYSILSKINAIAANKAAGNAANRAVGLTDTISGTTGSVIGGTAGGFAGGPAGAKAGAMAGAPVGIVTNKAARTFGPALMANAASSASGAAGVAAATRNNPGAILGTVGAILQNGPDAWAQQGIKKLGIQDPAFAGKLFGDPKAKQLLIQASDLAPNSKAMNAIMAQIKKGWGQS